MYHLAAFMINLDVGQAKFVLEPKQNIIHKPTSCKDHVNHYRRKRQCGHAKIHILFTRNCSKAQVTTVTVIYTQTVKTFKKCDPI